MDTSPTVQSSLLKLLLRCGLAPRLLPPPAAVPFGHVDADALRTFLPQVQQCQGSLGRIPVPNGGEDTFQPKSHGPHLFHGGALPGGECLLGCIGNPNQGHAMEPPS